MRTKHAFAISLLLLFALCATALAQRGRRGRNADDPEDEYYRLIRFPMSEQVVLEAGALEWLPDGKLAVATRRGEIYLVDQPLTERPEEAALKLYASGLHEVLGLAWRGVPGGGAGDG